MSIAVMGLKEGHVVEFFKDTRVEFEDPITFTKGTRGIIIKGGKHPVIVTEVLNKDFEFVTFKMGHSFFEKNCINAKPQYSIGLGGYQIKKIGNRNNRNSKDSSFEIFIDRDFVGTALLTDGSIRDNSIEFYGEKGKHLEAILRNIRQNLFIAGFKPSTGNFEQKDIESIFIDYMVRGFNEGMMTLEKYISTHDLVEKEMNNKKAT